MIYMGLISERVNPIWKSFLDSGYRESQEILKKLTRTPKQIEQGGSNKFNKRSERLCILKTSKHG